MFELYVQLVQDTIALSRTSCDALLSQAIMADEAMDTASSIDIYLSAVVSPPALRERST